MKKLRSLVPFFVVLLAALLLLLPANEAQAAGLSLKINRLYDSSLYTVAEGTVTNNGSLTYTFIRLSCDFKSSSDRVLDTDWTYACGSEGLAPGETATWRMSVKKSSLIDKCSVKIVDYDTKATSYGSTRSTGLSIHVDKVTSNSSYTVCTGTVTNNGSQTLRFIQLKGSFKTSSGTVVDTDNCYGCGGEGLAPGETAKFYMSVKKNTSIRSCDVTVYDYKSASYGSYKSQPYDLVISGISYDRSSGKTTATIRNTGSRTYKFVKVKAVYKNSSGRVVDIGDTYAVGSEGIRPGQSVSFRLYVDEDYSISKVTMSVYDYD